SALPRSPTSPAPTLFRSLAAGNAHPQVTIEETGDISASDARDRIVNRDLHRAELLSVPVTLLVLLIAFGAIVAALVPLLLALTRSEEHTSELQSPDQRVC